MWDRIKPWDCADRIRVIEWEGLLEMQEFMGSRLGRKWVYKDREDRRRWARKVWNYDGECGTHCMIIPSNIIVLGKYENI